MYGCAYLFTPTESRDKTEMKRSKKKQLVIYTRCIDQDGFITNWEAEGPYPIYCETKEAINAEVGSIFSRKRYKWFNKEETWGYRYETL